MIKNLAIWTRIYKCLELDIFLTKYVSPKTKDDDSPKVECSFFFHGASCPFVSSGSSEIKRVQNKREIILHARYILSHEVKDGGHVYFFSQIHHSLGNLVSDFDPRSLQVSSWIMMADDGPMSGKAEKKTPKVPPLSDLTLVDRTSCKSKLNTKMFSNFSFKLIATKSY